MGSKFFIIFCLGVLLQDAMGTLERRSYNPRFRNVNKKYLKASSTNGFDDGEKLEEMFLLDTKTKKVTKADVILVSMPMEESFNELAAEAQQEKHHNQHAAFAQHIPQKPNLSSQSEADSSMILENKPIVLQLLGWTGNPPPPIAFPPMPNKTSEVAPDMEAVPIVIKGDHVEEIIKPVSSGAMEADSLIVLGQDNQQEYIQEPEVVVVTTVEDKITNEEPTILVETVSEEKLQSSSVDFEKPTEVKPIEEIIVKTPVMLDIISEAVPVVNEPVPVIIQNEDKIKVSNNKLDLIQSAIIADMKLNHFNAGVKNEENASPVVEESSVVSVIIPESMPVMEESFIPQILETEHKKDVSEPKVEITSQKIDSEDKKAESSDDKMKITISADEAETVHKMDEAVEAVLALKKEENASPVVEEPSFISALIPENLLVMQDSMPNSVPEMLIVENKKEVSEPKVENINEKLDFEDKTVQSSDDKVKITSSVEEAEKVQKMGEVVEAVPVLLEQVAKPAELLKEERKEISKITPDLIQNAIIEDMKLNHFGVGINNKEESALPVVEESSVVSVVIPVENVPVIIESMQSSIPEISIEGEHKKEVSKPKIENLSQTIDSDDKKVESSDEKIKKPDSVEKPEKVQKTENKLAAYASYIFDKISENLSMKKTQANTEPKPAVNSESKKPSETELLKEGTMAAGEKIPQKQQTITLTAVIPKDEDDKKTKVPLPIIANVETVKENQGLENAAPTVESEPLQKPMIPELSSKVESVEILTNPSVVVESKVHSKIPSDKPCDKSPELSEAKETEVKKTEVLLAAAVKPESVEHISIKKPIQAEQSLLENKIKEVVAVKVPQAIQMGIISAENRKVTRKPAHKKPSRKPHRHPSRKTSTSTTSKPTTESSSSSSSASSETTEKTKILASSIVPDLGY